MSKERVQRELANKVPECHLRPCKDIICKISVDNEIPLVEEETIDSLDENNDENMQSILERLE
ncbi:hypothetical protein RhiirC2_777468 [Rhizophagus irregularis]|uniref:Uncharacterized protein n=1 Tax=Rhizophagus irregularis TaxID=588596 RepID=A0A2N1NEB5_9GLOM|nr:hypothetical protein RhiirC2_777468 [Rhizophagus irregularis]